jgi:hypothetical protein
MTEMPVRTDRPTTQAEQPILLLDLNYTLAANSSEVISKGRFYNVAAERYNAWLRDLIAGHYVILITVRPVEYRKQTLDRIWNELRWQPDEAFFNEWALNAPKCKELVLNKYVFPKHGQPDRTWYLAIESNDETARMYASYAIDRHRARDVRNHPGVLVKRGPAIDIPRLF